MPPAMLTLDDTGFPIADGRPLDLAPKERAVLALLMQRRPAVVSKEEFASAAWAGQAMSDESLARSISRLRRTLAGFGLTIESVYGTGYRLDGEAPAPAPSRLAGAAHAQPATVDAYLHARQLAAQRTPAAVGRAIELLRTLIAREPGYTPARVALAESLAAAIGWGQLPTEPSVEEGLHVLDEAKRLDPATPGLAGARGTLLDMAWRFDEAAQAHAEALHHGAQDPDSLLVHARHLLFTGQAAQAAEQLRAALRLSPHTPLLRMTLSRALVQAGRGAEGLAEADAASAENPGQLLLVAFALAMRAMVAPTPDIEAPAWRLSEGPDTPPFVWTVLSFVLAQLGRRDAALDIIDATLICSRTTTGEATLYAAPLAAIGEVDRAAALLQRAYDERCGMLAMVLRDPAHAGWLPTHPVGRALLGGVFGPGAATAP
ncbi:MAG TPA: winged helix-turn-helix domain-containing protein [Ideonella sp.]|uniref:winged helix-turn-helix domain-containing protein n=1 Tax=Ideonella sp. TaxID=1929293 RepID=UPI002E2EA775|nr:winged helix-turn-helix domain-containing protein [Ideonella sp.]HEX5687966.1 winged helix-turn-helix domain-containing protein [Ideonella sp.]